MSVFEAQATADSWDRDYYHPIALRYYDNAITTMLRDMSAKPGEVILDAGCGPGVHSIRAARYGCKVVGLDVSSMMLDQARQRAAAAGQSESISFQRGDVTNLTDIEDGAFQHVFSWGVLVHVPEIELALSELARVTKPGGSLALYLTNGAAFDHLLEGAARTLVGKRLVKQDHPLGSGIWYTMHGEQLWVRNFNIPAVIDHMGSRGFDLYKQRTGELSEIQRRVPLILRPPLLHLNNFWFSLNMPARLSVCNLLVLRKNKPRR